MLKGLLGLIVLVLDIVALISIWSSSHALLAKVLWTLAILFLPVLGLILWYLLGAQRHAIA